MINLFEISNYPDSEPVDLVAGTLWGWTRSDITAAYPPAAYTLVYRLSLQASPYTVVTITAGKVDGAHVVQQADTAAIVAGQYKWQAVIVRDADSAEVSVGQGFATVAATIAEDVGDTSSWVYQVLTAIRETIKGTASKERASYTVQGRTLQARSISELLELEREFSKRWNNEQRKAGTLKSPRRVLVGMSA